MILRALSVRQPWAWAIVQGLKPWENRPRRFNYRGPLLIHASKLAPEADYLFGAELIESLTGRAPPPRGSIERGGIVGAAELTDCAEPLDEDDGQWRGEGSFGLRFERAVTLPFRACSGALGLFKVVVMRDEIQALHQAGLIAL
jgi:hypothetical protein